MPEQPLDPALVNELGRVLFINDNPVEDGIAFEDVKDERQKMWAASRADYHAKARKILRIARYRGKMTLDMIAQGADS